MIPADLIPAWMARGLCAQVDPALWFPEKGGSTNAAKKICGRCPVRVQCLEDALSQELNPDGVWGGLSPRERAPLRTARGAAA